MFNVCYGCGSYNAAKQISPFDEDKPRLWAYAVCQACGYQHPFRKLPLFIVCGASGTGKTALCSILTKEETAFIPLEGDILWCPPFDKPDDNYRDFYEIWLRMAKNIGQAGRPVVLFSAGAGVPENLQNCVERRYFSEIHILALVCDDATLTQRLRNRPGWRNCNEAFINKQQDFNRWYNEVGPTLKPPITVLDNSYIPMTQTIASFKSWLMPYLPRDESLFY